MRFRSPIIAIFLFVFRPAEAAEDILIHIKEDWNNTAHKPLGIVAEGSKVTSTSTPLEQTWAEFNAKIVAFPGALSPVYGFAKAPFESSNPFLLRYGKGTVKGGNEEWPSNDSQFVTKNKNWKAPVTFDEFLRACSSLQCEPIIRLPYDSYLAALKQKSKKRCYLPDCLVPSREDLMALATEWVKYANKKNVNMRAWVVGDAPFHLNNSESPDTEKYVQDFVEFAKRIREVDAKARLAVVGTGAREGWNQVIQSIRKEKALEYVNYIVTRETGIPTNLRGITQLYKKFQKQNVLFAVQTQKLIDELEKLGAKIKILVETEEALSNAEKSTLGSALMHFEMLGQLLIRKHVAAIVSPLELSLGTFAKAMTGNENPASLNVKAPQNNVRAHKIWSQHLLDSLVSAGNPKKIENPKIRVYATASADRKKLNIFLLNKSSTSEVANIRIEGINKATGSVFALRSRIKSASKKIVDVNPEITRSVGLKLPEATLSLNLDAISLSVIELTTE